MKGYSKRTLGSMKGIDSRLIILIDRVMQRGNVDFTITEGMRTVERQRLLVKEGKSTTMNSRHLKGLAIDFIPYPFQGWKDIQQFIDVANEFKAVAEELRLEITYGGDWKSFKDYPHIQLDN